MGKLQLLSAGLATVLATPALARERPLKSQHRVENAYASAAPGVRNDEHSCIRVPRVGAFATQPWDSGPPCEPTWGYWSVRAACRSSQSLSANNPQWISARQQRQCNNELTEVGLNPTFAARFLSRDPDQYRSSKCTCCVIQWGGVQPWSNGKIGLNGIS